MKQSEICVSFFTLINKQVTSFRTSTTFLLLHQQGLVLNQLKICSVQRNGLGQIHLIFVDLEMMFPFLYSFLDACVWLHTFSYCNKKSVVGHLYFSGFSDGSTFDFCSFGGVFCQRWCGPCPSFQKQKDNLEMSH